jgi:hypothetical protein
MPAADDESTDTPIDVQRVLMDRARRQAARYEEKLERPLLPRAVGVLLALVVVVVVLFAFDRFLASMQRFMDLPVVDPVPAAPPGQIPAYVVPVEAAPPAGTTPLEAAPAAPPAAEAPPPTG